MNCKSDRPVALIVYGGFLSRPGGVGMHARSLKKQLIRIGWNARLLSLESIPFLLRYLPHIVEKIINIFDSPLGFYYKGIVTRLLYQSLLDTDADLYIFEDVYLTWKVNKPAVTILHAVWSDNLQAYKLLPEKIRSLVKKEVLCIENIEHGIATVSTQYRNYLLNKHFALEGVKKKIEVIELGLDLTLFSVNKHAKSRRNIIYCGALEARKNVSFLIDVFKIISNCDPFATLTIIGDGPQRDFLEKKANLLGLYVTFMGRQKHEDVIDVLRRHSIYVHTSIKESFSYSLLEAKLCGLITCALSSLEVPEEFIDIRFDQFDASLWAKSILEINVAFTPRIIDDYSVARMVDRTLRLAYSFDV